MEEEVLSLMAGGMITEVAMVVGVDTEMTGTGVRGVQMDYRVKRFRLWLREQRIFTPN